MRLLRVQTRSKNIYFTRAQIRFGQSGHAAVANYLNPTTERNPRTKKGSARALVASNGGSACATLFEYKSGSETDDENKEAEDFMHGILNFYPTVVPFPPLPAATATVKTAYLPILFVII